MREILFRGKLKCNGDWSYGNLIVKPNVISLITPDDTPLGRYGEIDPETVGQYTGLTDRNGKKIFEGDIVKVFEMIGEVVQECGAFGIHIEPCIDYDRLECAIPYGNNADFCFNDNFISLWELWWNYQQDDEPLEVVEVIGNIYDNPELIEVVGNIYDARGNKFN